MSRIPIIAITVVLCQGCGGAPEPNWRQAVLTVTETGEHSLNVEGSLGRTPIGLAIYWDTVEEALLICGAMPGMNGCWLVPLDQEQEVQP